jgi:hypothetical protein
LRVVAVIAMVLLIGACGTTGPAATASGSNPGANLDRALKFSQCMRGHGVSQFPDPNSSGQLTIDGVANGSTLDVTSAAFVQALSACRGLEPSGFMGQTRTPQQQKAALKFAQCMRDDGVPDFPDPTPNGPLIDTSRIPSAAGRGAHSIPGFQAASQKCIAIYSGQLGLQGR